MPYYPVLSVMAAIGVVLVECLWLHTGLFRDRTYWIAMAIVVAFMIPIDGWMSKTSDPIVIYNHDVLSGIRFPWDIPIEEFVYAFALITLTMLLWERAGRRDKDRVRSAAVDQRAEAGRR
jgi:lycopene cyclase domain-containing protein